jgi:hypothetical protein
MNVALAQESPRRSGDRFLNHCSIRATRNLARTSPLIEPGADGASRTLEEKELFDKVLR